MFIDDICDEISEGTNLELYADDTKIWREILTENDQAVLQTSIDNLLQWSIKNLMNFNLEKCKAMAITNKCLDHPLPFYEFFYHLGDEILDFTSCEKDLGVICDHKLSWNSQCDSVIAKAASQFNFVRRTCYFINDSKQRCELYISLIRSIFEHCCQIWAPQGSSLENFNKLQKRAVKWILKEQHNSYSDLVFLNKQKELGILPMKEKFIFSDLILFYRIIRSEVKIKLPFYISKIESQDVKYGTRSSQPIKDGKDDLKYVCKLKPRVKCFQYSFFVRTINRWNEIPYNIRKLDSINKFKVELKQHLWLILGIDPG